MKILVTDDEPRIRRLLSDYLLREGYEVIEAANGEEAVSAVYKTNNLSLVILDVMMPVMNGIEACKEIRSFSDIPILILTAKGQEDDELEGFSSGADDYLTKPFSMPVLLMRVQALLKRAGESGKKALSSTGLSGEGTIILDLNARSIKSNGVAVDATPREFELLHYFLKNKNIALSREQILNAVWNYDFYGDARTIDTHIKNLRMKLGSTGDSIRTVRGYGYKLESAED